MDAILQSLGPSLLEAVDVLLRVAGQGAIFAWGLWVGSVSSRRFFGKPSWAKVLLLAMPASAFIGTLLAFYRLKFMPDPRETGVEAMHSAMATFFTVVLTLWLGCVGGMFWEEIKPEFEKKWYEVYKADHEDDMSQTP